jgi:activator of HSP90 ATPase
MNKIQKKYFIKAPIEKVWESLVDPKIINAWGGGSAEMSDKVNEEFKLWGGDIYGKNTQVIKNKKLAQDWYGGIWDKLSKLIITLTEKGKETLLELSQENIPDNEVKDIDSGWDDYYFGPMKEYLEKAP